MEEAGVQFRFATLEDVEQIRQAIKHTLANPEGRTQRKRYEESVERREVLILTRYETRERGSRVVGFIEWHTRVDGSAAVRDAGTTGDSPQLGILKRLLRELLNLLSPPSLTVKVRADQTVWNDLFRQTAGFVLEGQEFSRPHWRNIWTWSMEAERLATQQARPTRPGRQAPSSWPRRP